MMATTHVFAGLAAVAPVASLQPELSTPLAAGAILGALVPDLDVLLDHRRTLHFPTGTGFVALPAAAAAVANPTALTTGLAAFALAAWIHAASDALGAGPTVAPWRERSDRAVFDHVRRQWIPPRRVIRYDGAPEDAALAVALAVPAWIVFDGWVALAVVVGVVVSVGYALVRRRLVGWLGALG